MTYKGAIDEVISLANNSLMPVIFKPSLKKIAETLEMERPKELTLSEVETYANEHNCVLWTEEMSEKALALIKADRYRPKKEWIPVSERLPKNKEYVLATDGVDMFVAWHNPEKEIYKGWYSFDKNFDVKTPILAWQPLPEPYKAESEVKPNE